MIVISVDPGKVTGVSVWLDGQVDNVELPAMESVKHVHAAIRSQQAAGKNIEGQLVCESYTVNANTVRHKRQYDALEVIGACRYLSLHYGLEFRLQPPPNRNLIKSDTLKKLGWWSPSKDKHMIDSAKHLAIACLRLGILKPEDL